MFLKKICPFLQKHGYACLFFTALLIFLFYPNVGIYDWDKEVLYSAYIKTSLLEYRQFPLFLWNSAQLAGYPAVDQSTFFAANPETMLFSSFLPLLLLFSPAVFLKLLVVLNGALGFTGVLALGKRLHWQSAQTRIFSALFLLSPIIIQHVAIGYLPWINLYLFPWLLFFLLSEDIVTRSLGSGMVLALVLLQGGSHVFIWLAFFVVLYMLWISVIRKNGGDLLTIPLAILAAVGLALPRFYLSFQSFATFSQRFFSGYSIRAFLQWGLVPPFFTPSSMDDIEYFIEDYIDGVPYWDGEVFWGVLIVLAVLLPFLFLHLRGKNAQDSAAKIPALAVACASAILLIFSFGGLYERVITYFSALLRLPALEGMEKYPFHFAIPAYYGFAFAVAACWPDWPGFFERVWFTFRVRWEQFSVLFWHFAHWLSKQRRTLNWLAGILLVLCITALALKPAVLAWAQVQISLAYSGYGASWLAGLMEHTGNIPMESYLAKARTLYGYVQHGLLGMILFSVLLWFLGTMQVSSRDMQEAHVSQCKFSPWILEVLLVAPLLLAFGMWWRVALATPQDTLPILKIDAPEISTVAVDDPTQVAILSFTPTSLDLTVSETQGGAMLVFSGIPAQDAQFLKIASGGASFIDQDGKLGVRVEQAGEVNIRVNPKLILIPSLIAGVAWLLCGWILFRKEKHKQVSLEE